MTNKERFIELYKTNIKRPGSEKLLEYLLSPHSDFFEAPASARFHGSYDGGLLEHSLNVYDCLKDYLQRERVKDTYQMNYSEETIAIVSLLHDLCKINCYKKGTRNVKKDGQWIQVPNYEYDDQLPYELGGGVSAYADLQYRHITYKMHGRNDKWNDDTNALQTLHIEDKFDFFNPKALITDRKSTRLNSSHPSSSRMPSSA